MTTQNKPEPIERKHYFIETHVKQTASGMLSLINILPFIMGKKVLKGDKKWITFLKLIQITFLCTNPYVSVETIQDLRNLIECHHISFCAEYPKASILPKMHFLSHLAKQIQRFGPSKFHWCMRFEAKHAFFKNKKWKCFKNLALSMANFHQKWLCGQMITSSGSFSENFLYSGDDVSAGEQTFVEEMSELHRTCIQQKFPQLEIVYLTKQVKIHGCTYKDGTILLYSNQNFDPHFVYVVSILIYDQEKMFLVQDLQIIDFDEHTLSYHVALQQSFRLVSYKNLLFKLPLDVHLFQDKLSVINKYVIVSADFDE